MQKSHFLCRQLLRNGPENTPSAPKRSAANVEIRTSRTFLSQDAQSCTLELLTSNVEIGSEWASGRVGERLVTVWLELLKKCTFAGSTPLLREEETVPNGGEFTFIVISKKQIL